ncbi:ParB/RepB/Spo0J family partition protein [Actinomadura sp. KC216]|uniref:ParB/RepB/Spo0J family partition protein n=1 Tax=Actinomadura sp. KC216 TaxID=2530370 RepID=UPI0010506459|nr:ParB/RepB/Spo0J family partition protein [Actinomadura sp. KC216]TDB83378.1 ParB/RepB/Spo0J family partition protein [Actinomadura sp. KC216]
MGSNAYLDMSLIHPHPANIREELGDLSELVDSVRAHGVVQPLVVRPHPRRRGVFELLAGHRRYAAARQAGCDRVPVTVRHGVDDGQALELMLVENCQRRELNAMEKAEAMGALINRDYTAADIARTTGLSSSTVSYYVALLELDEASRDKVRTGQVTASDAVAAVRRTRKRARAKAGSSADFAWEPDYLASTHPLARKARKLCDAREHTMRRRIGKTACGQCWESVIRQDERIVAGAIADELTSDLERAAAAPVGTV